MKNIMNDCTVYYTIINKNNFNFKFIKNSNKKLETVQSEYLLNCMLSYFGIKEDFIKKTKLGKPYFKDKELFFNYSHSKNHIACAVSKYNVGIDIEEHDRIITDEMIKICKLTSNDKLEELVKREAFCKLTGKGIAMIFNINNLKMKAKRNLTINCDKFICSIFTDCCNPSFKFVKLK